jgi:hypothetical protein
MSMPVAMPVPVATPVPAPVPAPVEVVTVPRRPHVNQVPVVVTTVMSVRIVAVGVIAIGIRIITVWRVSDRTPNPDTHRNASLGFHGRKRKCANN